MKKNLVLLFVFVLLAMPAMAEYKLSDNEVLEKNCDIDAAVKSYLCLQEKFPILEKEMESKVVQADKTMKNLLGDDLTDIDREALKNAQKGWLQYRDNQCNNKASGKMGQSASRSFIIMSCLVTKTQERILEIEQTYLGKGE